MRFLTAIELFQHSNKYAEYKIFHDAFKRREFRSYNHAFLASISNTVLKASDNNYTNVHYVKMTAVELLNFRADKFSFSPFLAVVALTNVIKAPVNVLCNTAVDVRPLVLYNCCIQPQTEEKLKYFYFGSQVPVILQNLIILYLL